MLGPTPAPPRPRSLLLGVCLDSQGTFLPQTCRWPVRAKSLGPLLPLSILAYPACSPESPLQAAHLVVRCFQARGPAQIMVENARAARREKRPR